MPLSWRGYWTGKEPPEQISNRALWLSLGAFVAFTTILATQESMPYYVSNKVFMPGQRAFDYRVYFNRARSMFDFRLGDLIDVADSLACARGQIVLVGIGHPKFASQSAGRDPAGFRGANFTWDSADRARMFERGKPIAAFTRAMGDENYYVFEFLPDATPGCTSRRSQND